MNTKKHDIQVFISHARNDDLVADEVAKALTEQGLIVWSDESIAPGSDWKKEIQNALENSDYIISLLTSKSFSSNFVRNELDYALFNNRYKNRFLPVLIGDESKDEFSRLPWLLKKLKHLYVSDKKSPKLIANEVSRSFLQLVESQLE